MSYADVAASGPSQSAEEARAPPVPSLSHSDFESTSSLVDVDSVHVNSVSSDFLDQDVKTETQATRREHEAEDKARAAAQKAEAASKEAKDKAESKAKKAKAAAKREGRKLQENKDNPVYVGNALIWAIGITAIGAGAYQKHKEGKLDAKLAATVAGAVGAFAVADYYASSWLLENKYPTK